jgi:hypothetical protein
MRTALRVLLGAVMLALPVLAFAQGEVLYVINDKVGIGTSNPTEKLTVVNPSGNASLLFDSSASANFLLDRGNTSSFSRFQLLNAGTMRWSMGMINDASNDFHLGPSISTSYLYVSNTNGRVGIGTKTPGHPLQMGSGAHVTTGGVWTDASSRSLKQDIAELSLNDASATLSALEPVTFAYTADPTETYVGFIAEDVPALVATGDRTGLAPMDIVAVLTKVLQEQQRTIAALQARVAQLETK